MPNLVVTNPYDESAIGELPMHEASHVMEMLKTAYGLKEALPLPERMAILRRAATLVKERASKLAKCAAREGGKPLVDSEVEVNRGVEGIRSALSTLATLTGSEVPMGLTKATEGRLAFTMREPIGVVFGISAFNHPFNLIVHQVIPAVAAGCPVIIKPALTTPLSCQNLVEILYEAGLPKEWCQIAICDDAAAEEVAKDARLSYLSFIGSTTVGWHLRSLLAPGVKCTLEHGGSAPVIVLEDADVKALIPPLVKGGFYHAGQVCVSVQRVFVPKKRIEEVVSALASAASQLIVGDPLKGETHVGPLILPREVKRIEEWVKSAGGQILCGGKALSNTCYAPTVLVDPKPDATVSKEEIFGPVVCIYPYDSLDEALAKANDAPFSFQASVFGKDIDTLLLSAKRLKGCAVMVNDHTAFRADWMPFGGRETSGLGVGGIPYAIRDLSVEKLVVIRTSAL